MRGLFDRICVEQPRGRHAEKEALKTAAAGERFGDEYPSDDETAREYRGERGQRIDVVRHVAPVAVVRFIGCTLRSSASASLPTRRLVSSLWLSSTQLLMARSRHLRSSTFDTTRLAKRECATWAMRAHAARCPR